jgi:lipopolysaccharide/colanic/teichoic acid biosynthesis glycosyltransferase
LPDLIVSGIGNTFDHDLTRFTWQSVINSGTLAAPISEIPISFAGRGMFHLTAPLSVSADWMAPAFVTASGCSGTLAASQPVVSSTAATSDAESRIHVVPASARPLCLRNGARDVYSKEQVREALRRERSRSDRSGRGFSLVIFETRGDERKSLAAWLQAGILASRIRDTDEIGWFNDYRVCAILSDTSSAGARWLAECVCELVGKKGAPRPLYEIYSYPTDWFVDDHGLPTSRTADRRTPTAGLINQASPSARTNANVPPMLTVSAAPAAPLEELMVQPMPIGKRGFDIIASALGLLVLSPILLITALAVRLTSPGSCLFRQRRAGLGNKPFTMYKFRTMVMDAEARKRDLMAQNEQDGPAFKIKNDPRLTPIGRFLRRTSIDELPQLLNVLKGDMSIVGPRPLPCGEADGCERWQRARLDVTPGLTCIWQVQGRSRVTFSEWVRMDLAYIRKRTPIHDLLLLIKTVPAVLWGTGAH